MTAIIFAVTRLKVGKAFVIPYTLDHWVQFRRKFGRRTLPAW